MVTMLRKRKRIESSVMVSLKSVCVRVGASEAVERRGRAVKG